MTPFIAIQNRDAYAPIRGYLYQIDLTIRAWLNLKSNQLLVLENGEDIDHITKGIEKEEEESIILEQIKHLEDVNITLRRGEFIESLVNFKIHQHNNPDKNIFLRFTTNTLIGEEANTKQKGLETWKRIYDGTLPETDTAFTSIAENIRKILLDNATAKKYKDWFSYIEGISIEDFVKSVIKKVEIADATVSFGEDIENALIKKIKTVFGYDKDDAETFLHQLRIYVFKKLSQKEPKELSEEDLVSLNKHYAAKTLDKNIRLSRILHSYYDKINEKLDRIDNKLDTINSNQNEGFNYITQELAALNNKVASMQPVRLDEEFNKGFSSQIDDINKFIDNFDYEKALEHLLFLEKHHFENLNSNNRYRILVNIGLCYNHLDKVEEAGNYFIKVLIKVEEKTSKEFGIVALGYALLRKPIETNKYITLALAQDVKCVFAYMAMIAIEDLTTPLETLIQNIPTDIQTDIEICHAISVFASRKNQHKEAKKWLQIALDNLPDTSRNKISLQAEYAVASMRCIMEEYNYALLSNQYSSDIFEEIEKCYNFFDTAWQTLGVLYPTKKFRIFIKSKKRVILYVRPDKTLFSA
jgi:tetratricopeptide (TPR) repeat protein